MRRIIVLFFFALVIASAIFVALVFTSSALDQGSAAACRPGDVLDGVHHPSRINVIDPCVTVKGTVAVVKDHEDGDWDIGLIPDPSDIDLLGRGNITKMGGLLVVEVIPKDQPVVKRPRAGSRVAITGAYVIDTPNGWREIHPAWDIQEISPSPIPQGIGQRVRAIVPYAKKVLIRLRAELRERLAPPAPSGGEGVRD